jgi:hypothetical protein
LSGYEKPLLHLKRSWYFIVTAFLLDGMSFKSISIACALFLAPVLTGCSGTTRSATGLYDRLNNRGPVLLSSDNPFLPANRLLSQELESSSEMRDFVAKRGSPAAIAVRNGILERTELSLFYPSESEVYTLVRKPSGWVVGAPEPLSDETLARLEEELAVGGFSTSRPAGAVLKDGGQGDLDQEHSARARFDGKWPSWPQQATSNSHSGGRQSAVVRIARNGTLTHTVTFPGESLSVVAVWYTGAASNLYLISRANGIAPEQYLKLGEQVVIPAKIAKNKKPLTAAAVQRLRH